MFLINNKTFGDERTVKLAGSSKGLEALAYSLSHGLRAANAYVVKPVDFNEFFQAIKLAGNCWRLMNKTPDNRQWQGPARLENEN